MQVLHLNWVDGALRLWAESRAAHENETRGDGIHPFAVPSDTLAGALEAAGLVEPGALGGACTFALSLPGDEEGPLPSDRLSGLLGEIDRPAAATLGRVEVPALALRNDCALSAVLRLEDLGPTPDFAFGHSVPYWIAVARFVLELLADQRFIPTLIHVSGAGTEETDGTLRAAWKPWLHDEAAQARLSALLTAMPPVCRAAGGDRDVAEDGAWSVLSEALAALCDAAARRALREADYLDAIADREAADDMQVAWLGGLLGDRDRVVWGDGPGASTLLLREVRGWLGRLEDPGHTRPFRLCFRLAEPADETRPWRLGFLLRLEGDPPLLVDIDRVWAASAALVVDGHRVQRPQEWLLGELGRASRIYPTIETALAEAHPVGVDLTTEQAAQFLREDRELLEESGFDVIVPEWWGTRASRLGLRLRVESPEAGGAPGGGPAPGGPGRVGVESLVRFRWQIAVGDEPLTAEQLRLIAESAAPLIRIGDRWVENEADRLTAAAQLVDGHEGGEVTLREAMRLARGAVDDGLAATGLPVLGMDAGGWVGRILDGDGETPARLPRLDQPPTFMGALRPYQKTGLSWLTFLERFGFGACLADDMGLGKTIQLIALLLHERGEAGDVGPTLLVVPTSLIGNWSRELERFAPTLSYHVHHGPQRLTGASFTAMASRQDIVITTYALVPRDRETLGARPWWRVVLDEAQYIKNPPTRQASAIRELRAPRRVALTGTPVENRLGELWSIMEFCNPGYLGPAEEFRRRCAVPIERHRDRERAEELRRLVHPFVLRRLKTDPTVITDLPPCVETKEFATLTAEQAALYQAAVDHLLSSVESAEGIQRRGRVLAALTRLKQICNHPAQLPDAVEAPGGDGRTLSSRSGKSRRLLEMLEELLAAGDRALIFTQYRRMGDLLAAMIRQDLDADVMFMHGGTTPRKRQEMIDRFQAGEVPVFVLSLKTGGVGLNLTAANHVFHFDRWWNPAVENQATDRAFRIGQTRTVHVHKFVCAGTLEERIDQMIEQKTELAGNIIGSGEQWITELDTGKLHEILRLRATAVEGEA